MAFEFQIKEVIVLSSARIAVIEGVLLSGCVRDGQRARLIGAAMDLQVVSVVMGLPRQAGADPRALSLSVKLSEPSLDWAKEGALLRSS